MIGFNVQKDVFPLGLSYLKSFSLKKHADVEFKIKEFGFGNRFHYDANRSIELKVINYILLYKPELVVFSSYVWSGEVVKKICRAVKICNPKIKTLIGGVEVVKEDLNEFIDYIITGEGELAFSNLISYLKKEIPINKVNNLIHSTGENKNKNINNLDDIPNPYETWEGKKEFEAVRIETARGCNFGCKYCHYAKKDFREFSIGYLKKSIKYLFDNFNFRNLTILDAHFNIDKKRMKKILDIIESNIKGKLRVNFELKPELIDKEVISVISKRKFKISCELGLQTIDKNVIDACNRPFAIEKVKNGLKLLDESKINYKIDLMYGLPEDNFYKFLRSLNFLTTYSSQKTVPAHHFMVLNNTDFSKCVRYDPNNSSKVIKTDTQDCTDFYKIQMFLNMINKRNI